MLKSLKSTLTIALLSTCTWLNTTAQTTSLSPYSRYGIGDLNLSASTQQLGMGGIGVGFAANNFINLANPAANSFLDKPVFDFAIKRQSLTLSNSTDSRLLETTYINHFAYAFPVKNKFCLTAGLVPFSRMGYELTNSEALTDSTSVNYNYKGRGGFNKAFLGTAYKVYNHNDSSVLSIGFNLNFMFGTLRKDDRAIFTNDDYFSTRKTTYTSVRDLAFDLGAYYTFYPSSAKDVKINVGAAYGFSTKLNATQEAILESYESTLQGNEYVIDTAKYVLDEKGSISLPATLSFGTSAVFKNRWVIGVDYRQQQWSKFSQSLATTALKSSLKNSSQLSVGLQYTPKPFAAPKTNFFLLMNYRLGYRMEKTYTVIKGTQIGGQAFTAGIGIPLKRSNSLSRINIGYELFTRGTTNNGLLKENYSNLIIGVSISPSSMDRWFYKRKYD